MFKKSEFVIISTNDIHASIDNMPQLATAIKECRDTVFTVVVDAGDRWTGNAYVDLADGRLPIIELMNKVGYDVVTLGNHEFDAGPELLDRAIRHADFDVVCANMDTDGRWLGDVDDSESITTPDGVEIDFIGVVTSYAKGRPDGNDSNFEGLTFKNPKLVALHECKDSDSDVKVLLSHMGHDRDIELVSQYRGYDVVLGGHTHKMLDTIVNGTTIGQTGRKLKYVGVTKVQMRGDRVVKVEYTNIPLENYAKDAEVEQMVQQIQSNPTLKRVVGQLANDATHVGLCNLQTKIIKEAAKADIGIYNRGGVRTVEGLPAGDVTIKDIFDNEPFLSPVHTAFMTPAQLRNMIITKYNDTVNTKESHCVDLYATTPYTIITDENDIAYDVEFPKLREGKQYKIAIADYVARNYSAFECKNEKILQDSAYDLDVAYFEKHGLVNISNESLQRVAVRKRR